MRAYVQSLSSAAVLRASSSRLAATSPLASTSLAAARRSPCRSSPLLLSTATLHSTSQYPKRRTALRMPSAAFHTRPAAQVRKPNNDANEMPYERAGSFQSRSGSDEKKKEGFNPSSFFNSTGFETAMGASLGVLLLGFAAVGYMAAYKRHVISKMQKAFDAGYDPVLALSKSGDQRAHVDITPLREEDVLVQSIVDGKEAGRYFLILGSKGSGKTTSMVDAMARNAAEGCAFFDAHQTPEIVVDRFAESINYSMNRDYLGNLLGLSDLSGMTSFQALERALHKLEKALLKYAEKKGRPAVIVMNQAHLLGRSENPEEGVKLLHLFQQRAERWASAGCCTFVFITNDYWVFDNLRKNSNRMDTLTFKDLSREQAIRALRDCRVQYYGAERAAKDESNGVFEKVYEMVGGRISLINKIARRQDMARAVAQLVEDDLAWLQSKTGIIEDHDDDVMDEQKWSTCSWLLFCELAKRQAAMEQEIIDDAIEDSNAGVHLVHPRHDEASGTKRPQSDATDPSEDAEPSLPGDIPNPSMTWGEARQVMTRADFLMELDHLNIIHVDRHHHIRADSMPLLRAFRVQAEEEGYEDKLKSVMDRVAAIESLGRTRELVWKEQGKAGAFLVHEDARGKKLDSWRLLGGDERLDREEEDFAGDVA